jgi:hypothetical protein
MWKSTQNNDDGNTQDPIETTFECFWLPTISYVQMEDSSGYGYPLSPVGKYNSNNQADPLMILWLLIGAIVGSKDLCVSWSPVKGVQVVRHAIPIANPCPR